MTKDEFDKVVESVRVAIELGTHPKMISQGSSGSYFARNTEGKVVGVFKPKDEEPYASKNPKWTKWLHRNLFPFAFGRACLIPNLSYVSEAAAYVLDTQLRTNLVPYTDIVSLSSKSFYYDFWERRAYYRKKKPFPEKIGSFQVFLKGFKDANVFLKEHPWPDQHNSSFRTDVAPKKKRRRWDEDCRPRGAPSDDEEDYDDLQPSASEDFRSRSRFWTDSLQQSFREQLEKLVILDYIMRNTDRGLDNWMIRIDEKTQKATIVAEPPKTDEQSNGEPPTGTTNGNGSAEYYKRRETMTATNRTATPTDAGRGAKVSIGAIDNSLSWPWKHPDAAWNVVETLKTPDHGPLELTRRARVCVWDDLVDIPVAVPLRVPSAEMRRRQAAETRKSQNILEEEEEMDISAAHASSAPQPQHDLLGLGAPASELQTPNRFNISRQTSSNDARNGSDDTNNNTGPLSSPAIEALSATQLSNSTSKPRSPSRLTSDRPPALRSATRMSYEEPHATRHASPDHHRHRSSFAARRASSGFLDDDDDLEGDLGYAAAEDMEANKKKVIVERLETVKSKNPVFTWC
ncbi:Phosphatidylinositol 4-kinase LSB6 [Cryomyces antarcticus]|nr:Phosphatidylinositol 4-kinase LSB6 [Cryomyces antarcticus]